MTTATKARKGSMQDKHVQCRAYGHAWDRDVPANIIPENIRAIRGFVDVIRCLRCQTIRVDELDFSGYVQARSYYYEDDYSNVTHLERHDARVWLNKNDRNKAVETRLRLVGRGDTRSAKQVKAKKAAARKAS